MAPTAFISYSHDSPAQAERVLRLADRLRAHGVGVEFDQHPIPSPTSS